MRRPYASKDGVNFGPILRLFASAVAAPNPAARNNSTGRPPLRSGRSKWHGPHPVVDLQHGHWGHHQHHVRRGAESRHTQQPVPIAVQCLLEWDCRRAVSRRRRRHAHGDRRSPIHNRATGAGPQRPGPPQPRLTPKSGPRRSRCAARSAPPRNLPRTRPCSHSHSGPHTRT